MAGYPIRVRTTSKMVKNFSAPIALEFSRRIEDYVNDRAKEKSATVINYFEISSALGISKAIVRDLLFPVDGGHNGITVNNPQAEKNNP